MSKFLLKEYFALSNCPDGRCDVQLLTEEEKRMRSDGSMILTGIIQVADIVNGNNRIYPRSVLERELQNYQKVIKEKRSLGELDHSEESVINLKNVSHMILRAWMDGNKMYGVLKVLNTPSGNTLKNLVNDGVTVGISSRSLGSLTESSRGSIVNDDLVILGWDCVSESSAPGAYLHLKESRENKSVSLTKSDRIYRSLNDILRGK